jgi:hypothetical protein
MFGDVILFRAILGKFIECLAILGDVILFWAILGNFILVLAILGDFS